MKRKSRVNFNPLHILFYFSVPTQTVSNRCYILSFFTDEGTEAQKAKMIGQFLHIKQVAKPGFEHGAF